MKRFKYMALAALVAFAACDEGTDVIVTPPVTGEVSGTVTVEGTAVSGVKVSLLGTGLSPMEVITGAAGAYSFVGVAAGAYTVVISEFALEIVFSATSKVVNVGAGNSSVLFDGTYVRTSAILGSVAAGGVGVAGVKVSIGSKSMVTDVDGLYGFTGLRAGEYTVTITEFNSAKLSFANTSLTKAVAMGETGVLNFSGLYLATGVISGTLYLDGNGNLTMDSGELPVMKAGISVALERAIGDTIYTLTDANGDYAFTDLEEGTYKAIMLEQDEFPGAFSLSSETRYLAVATAGGNTKVNFAFVVTTQYVQVYGMLGRDEVNVGVAPIKNWSIGMFPTQLDAAASSFPIVTAVKTDANGLSTFKFLRSKDFSPNSATVDGIVFAKVAGPGPLGAPSASYTMSNETVIEIPWLPMDSMVMAPDTFDALFNSAIVKVHVQEVDLDTLAFWKVQTRSGKDSTAAVTVLNTNGDGDLLFPWAGVPANYPDTMWFRLVNAPTQTLANGHGYNQTPTAGANGSALGSYLRVIWDGTAASGTKLEAGTITVAYTDVDVRASVHRELDDTAGFSAADSQILGAAGVRMDLRKVTTTGTTLTASLTATSGVTATQTFSNIPVAGSYQLRGRALTPNYVVLNDTSLALTLDGSDQVTTVGTLKGSAGTSSFMVKTNNNTLDGKVKTRYGVAPARGLVVSVMPTARNIQGTAAMMDTTDANGSYSFAGLREGPYSVMVSAGDSAYTFLRKLTTTFSPAASTIRSSLTDDNDSPTAGTRDLEGFAANMKANFEGYRTDVEFSGLVVNDRDADATVIDPGEALVGATFNLYMDDDNGAIAGLDTLVATTTTNAGGMYSFTGLREGRYTAVWAAGTPNADARVMRALTVGSVSTTRVSATPTFGADVAAAGSLPAWDYSDSSTPKFIAPANFTFLYATTEVSGTATLGVGGGAASGMTITLQRCYQPVLGALTLISGPLPEGLAGVTCAGSYFTGSFTRTTDATGAFSFKALQEGVYRVTMTPSDIGLANWTTAGGTANASEAGIYLTAGAGDIETLTYVIW